MSPPPRFAYFATRLSSRYPPLFVEISLLTGTRSRRLKSLARHPRPWPRSGIPSVLLLNQPISGLLSVLQMDQGTGTADDRDRQDRDEGGDLPRGLVDLRGGEQVVGDLAEGAEHERTNGGPHREPTSAVRPGRVRQPDPQRVGAVRLDADWQGDRGVDDPPVGDAGKQCDRTEPSELAEA